MATFEQIMSDLKKKVYHPLYFLMGEEPYFVDQITDYITEHVLTEQDKAFNQLVLYGKDASIYSIIDAAKRFPMMVQYQVVIVKEAQNLKDIDKLLFYAEKPLSSTILVFAYKYKTLDKRSKLYKLLNQSAVLFDSAKLYDNKIPEWISGYLDERGYSAHPTASVMLSEYLGNNLEKIANEIGKLIISLPNGEKKITPELVERNVGISKEYNVFELQKALGDKDILKTNRIIGYFESNPKDNPMVMIVSSIFSFFVKVLSYHYLDDKSQAASVLRINPYFVRQYESAARKYPAAKIVQIISHLREYDLKSKGVGNSSASDGDLMKELVFKILH